MVDPDKTLGTKTTPMNGDGKPIHSDKNGEPFNSDWNYRSVVGTLMYLATNSRPDIAHAVHSCACFDHNPKQSHGKALLHICKYLKGTSKDGLIQTPSKSLTLDLYVDANYAGLYSVEDPTDPICSKLHTGFVITLAGCQLIENLHFSLSQVSLQPKVKPSLLLPVSYTHLTLPTTPYV